MHKRFLISSQTQEKIISVGTAEHLDVLSSLISNSSLALPLLAFQVNTIIKLNMEEKEKSDQNSIWSDQMVREILQDIMLIGSQHISKVGTCPSYN
jgi:hypothetical protein